MCVRQRCARGTRRCAAGGLGSSGRGQRCEVEAVAAPGSEFRAPIFSISRATSAHAGDAGTCATLPRAVPGSDCTAARIPTPDYSNTRRSPRRPAARLVPLRSPIHALFYGTRTDVAWPPFDCSAPSLCRSQGACAPEHTLIIMITSGSRPQVRAYAPRKIGQR